MCPWNSFAEPAHDPAFIPRAGMDGPSLIEWMGMSQEEFSRRWLLLNVAVTLGSWGSSEAVPVLAVALNDEEPLVRGHAAWALGRIPDNRSGDALRVRLLVEEDEWVISEIESAFEEH